MTARSGFDPWVTALALLASVLGLVAIFDAGYARSIALGQGLIPGEFRSQSIALAVALVAGTLAARVPASTWRRLAPLLFVLALGGLIAVKLWGVEVNGARRWVPVGPFRLQPSEFVKVATVLLLAAVYARSTALRRPRPRHWGEWMDFRFVPALSRLVPVAGVGAAVVLIEREPDLGTAAMVAAILFCMMILGGVRWRTLLLLAGAGAALLAVMVRLEPYRLERIVAHAERWHASRVDEIGYQTTQSEAAMATGGLWGVGLGAGRVKHVLPAATSDFVLATVAEETGLIGALVVVGVLAALALRLAWLATRSPTRFGRLVLAGTATWLGIQTAVNVLMANGTLPAIGIPLPFVSSGGSSLLALWVMIGTCQSALVAPRPATEESLALDRDRWRHRRARLSRA